MQIDTTPRLTKRRKLEATLCDVARRVRSSEFSTQSAIAAAFGVDAATISRWRKKILRLGLIEPREWKRGLLAARMREIG